MVERDDFDLDGWLDLCRRVYDALRSDDLDLAIEIMENANFGLDDLTGR